MTEITISVSTEESDMASDQFILEMHDKLYPDKAGTVHDVEDLTGEQVQRINEIIDDKHALSLTSAWCEEAAARIDLRALEHILTSASLSAHAGLEKQREMEIGEFCDIDNNIDKEKIKNWETNTQYYEDQLLAIKTLEAVVDRLRKETHKKDFYMRARP
jgi:hypothetical protein